ncbi:glycoside hydrolase family 9 protein [Paenibacillus athensensis]|nr:glycoside hydrolase family 9 protein [Paenibacillus athensensis]MCD1260531.1 glycoside hydrolase family 9 protein [Paenibacillus athensensis]
MKASWTRPRGIWRKGWGTKGLALVLMLVLALPFAVAGTASADFGTSKVLVNQIGYLPLANKVATIVTPATMTSGTTFKVINTTTNLAVKTGTTTVKGLDNASGDFVHKADFSDVTALGTYRVEVPALTTGGVSVNFVVANDIYPNLPKDAMGYFYFHRLGADLDGFSGTPYYRKAIHDWNTAISCYYPRGNDSFDGPIYPSTIPADWCGGEKLNVKNAWADAGDFGTYPVNHAISAWTLLNLYEVDPTVLPNNSLNVSPAEKTNGVSDLLDEVNFGSTYLRGMLPTNTSLLASHKITNDDFGIRPGIDPWWQDSWSVKKDTFYNWNVANGTGNPSQIFASNIEGLVHFENKMNDYILNGALPIGQTRNTLRYAQPPSTAATYAVARVAAQLARTLSASTDATTQLDAQKYWATAKDAWQRATTLPTIIRNQVDHPAGDPNSRQFESPGGGDYPDAVITDDKYAAAVEMYLTAHKLGDANKATYKSAVTGAGSEYKKVALFDWQSSGPSGSLSLITVPNDLPAADITSIENNVLSFADTQLTTIASEGYPTPLAPIWNAGANRYEYDWGSNALVVNKMIMLGHAFEITKKRGTPDLKYLKGMYQAMDYLMGTNALNISFITGYGQFYEKVTHDRLAYNLYHFDNIPYPKGWLAGGPNNASNGDGVTPSGLPPAKTYAGYGTDGNVQAFASKENTINWNAPLAWVATYMNANKSYLTGSTLGTSTLSATAGNASASISWTAATGATSYTLQTSPTSTGTFSNVTGAVGTTSLSFNASGLTNGTTYCYRVVATNGSSTTTSNVVCVTPTVSLGTSTLSATAGNASASISWTAATGATSYTLQTSPTSTGTFSNVSGAVGTTSLSFNASGLTNGTTYCYRVVATNGSSTTTSNVVCVTPTVSLGTSTLSATAGNASASISWTAATGATSYTLQTSPTSTGTFSNVTGAVGTTSLSFNASGLTNGTTYCYRVIATNGSSTTTSNVVCVTPTAPLGTSTLSATAGNASASISWTAATGATSYTLQTSPTSTGTFSNVTGAVGTTSLSFNASGLTNGTTYCYRVVATNGSSTTTSNVVCVTPTAPLGTSTLSATAGNASASISWTAATGATSYTLQTSPTSTGTFSNVTGAVGTTSLSFNASGLTNGTTYCYRVVATNGSSTTTSNVVCVTPAGGSTPTFTLEYHRDTDGNATDNKVHAFFRITNTSAAGSPAVNYSDLKIRYWYTKGTTTAETFTSDYAPVVNTSNVLGATYPWSPSVTGADTYMEIGFKPGPTLAAGANSGEIQGRVNKVDWTNYSEADDYSYLPNQYSFAANNKVALYYQGQLVWGTEPSTPSIPAAPASLTATGGNGSVALSWPASTNATSYTVYRSTTNGSGYTALSAGTGISATSFTDTTVTNGVTYYYVVKATNSAGSSGNSPQASATPNATATSLAVQYRAMDTISVNNQIQFVVSIKNNGTAPVNFSDYKIRYYFTSDGATTFNLFCDWASDSSTNQCGNVTRQVVALATPVSGATHYVEIGFASGMGQVPAGTVSGNVQIRLHKGDWSNFTEAGDYSFDPSKTTLTDWNKVTLLNASNVILWGTAP